MRDIIDKALAQHKLAGNAEITWTVAFVNGDKLVGTINSFGDGRYALINAVGPVYFTSDGVVYLHPN
jgi:sRNA-binding regulator protein Hfq